MTVMQRGLAGLQLDGGRIVFVNVVMGSVAYPLAPRRRRVVTSWS